MTGRTEIGPKKQALLRDDVHELAAGAAAELDHAVGGGEKGVVAATAHVVAGVELGSPLADDDRAGGHLGAVVDLHAEALGIRVTAVPGGCSLPL